MNLPNIIYILADDMGYGDLNANNPGSKIPTPNLDRLAAQGMRFTDAHAPSSVCTPSRYSALTGRYCWRSRLKRGIVWEWDAPLIEADRLTVAGLLQDRGYHTACIGKWHLGWDWATMDGRHPNDDLPFGEHAWELRKAYEQNIDYARPVGGGPITRGFDTYFGVDVPNFSPYTWFDNDRLTEIPTQLKGRRFYGNPGLAIPDWKHEAMIPEFTRRAVELIESRADKAQPYYLHLPLTSPHSPVVPNDVFKGKSGAGNYGDFVCEVDWVVGEIMSALARTGTASKTLLVFTSDNGPEDVTDDDIGVYARAQEHRHYSMGDLRGIKLDAWEGGHRVPFVAQWPGTIPAGVVCGQLISHTDWMATCAEIAGAKLPAEAGEDSISIAPLLRGGVNKPVRDSAVHHSSSGRFAIRRGDWIFIDSPNGGDRTEPEWFRAERGYVPHDQPGELFNLREDLSERRNRYAEHPGLVRELGEMLTRCKEGQPAEKRGTVREFSE